MSVYRMFKSTLVLATLLMTAAGSQAAGRAVGTDVIRLVDQGQALGDTLNVFYQTPMSAGSAAVFTLALDSSDRFMLEGALKSYSGGYMNGVYYQVGAAFYETVNNSDFGLHAAIGYEQSPATNFLFFGAVKANMLLDGDVIEYNPMLGAMFVF